MIPTSINAWVTYKKYEELLNDFDTYYADGFRLSKGEIEIATWIMSTKKGIALDDFSSITMRRRVIDIYEEDELDEEEQQLLYDDDMVPVCFDICTSEHYLKKLQKSATKRQPIPTKLRYKILKRDNFRCCKCGASPEDGITELHVDHIIPVSLGGPTTEDNLQTLCSKCNLGKSNDYTD